MGLMVMVLYVHEAERKKERKKERQKERKKVNECKRPKTEYWLALI